MHYNFLEYLALQLDLKRHYTLCFYWDQTFTLKKFKVLKTNGLKSRKKFLLKFVEVKIVIFISPKHRSDCSRVISLIVGFANFLGVWMSEYACTDDSHCVHGTNAILMDTNFANFSSHPLSFTMTTTAIGNVLCAI